MAKTILITGASSGFGRLTAETLSSSGHKVFAGLRSTDGAKKQVADELRGKNIEILKLDVTDQGSVESAIAQLLEKSNNLLDVVVNNAGMASAGISEAFTPEQARELFDVNVFGVQRIIRDRKSTRLNSSHGYISYAVFCLKKKKEEHQGKAGPWRQRRSGPISRDQSQCVETRSERTTACRTRRRSLLAPCHADRRTCRNST